MLILGMINEESKRLTIEQIKKHAFFAEVDWKNLASAQAPYVPSFAHPLDVGNFDEFTIDEPWTDK